MHAQRKSSQVVMNPGPIMFLNAGAKVGRKANKPLRRFVVKILIPSIALVLAFGYGCASKKPGNSIPTNQEVTDLRPLPQPPTEMAYTAAPAPEPLVTQTPTAATPAGPVYAAPYGATYTVKKGDTLFRIAKDHYGDGKQWQRSASANPGVTPNALRVGQKLVVP
jgi:LysM repeat protein